MITAKYLAPFDAVDRRQLLSAVSGLWPPAVLHFSWMVIRLIVFTVIGGLDTATTSDN
jgi:purine-cytosine permease-like protein